MRRHFDFEMPDWGEFDAPPVGNLMVQSPNAGHPDRGQIGVRLALDAGSDTAYVSIPLDSASDCINCRFTFNATALVGGTIYAAEYRAGQSTLGAIGIDPVAKTVVFSAGGQVVGVVPFSPQLRWHCISVRFERASDQIHVALNGIMRLSINLPLGAFDPTDLRFGCPSRDPAAQGIVDLDELIISDHAIETVVAPPGSSYATDPAGWLLIYDVSHPDSVSFAQTAHDRRGIPYANLVGLDLPHTENVGTAEFEAIRTEVSTYLASNGLENQILGIWCGHGVPGRVSTSGSTESSLCSMLASITDPLDPTNASAHDELKRPASGDLAGVRLTCRTDGPSLEESVAVLDAADAVTDGVLNASSSVLMIDPYGGKGSAGAATTARIESWLESLLRQHLRLPLIRTASEDPGINVTFQSVSSDGFFWGWSQPVVAPEFFAAPTGRRVAAVQIEEEADALGELRSLTPDRFGNVALRSGYASVIAATGAVGMAAVPQAERFFEALRRGWTIAEAWFVSRPQHDEYFTLVGDPFMTAPIPKTGIDLFGGIGEIEHQSIDDPIARFPDDGSAIEIPTDSLPLEGEVASFTTRRIDSLGVAEASMRWQRLRNVGGVLRSRPILPAWPQEAGWYPQRTSAGLFFRFVWSGVIDTQPGTLVALMLQRRGQAEGVAVQATLASGRSSRDATAPAPSIDAHRYRLRVTTSEGVVEYGPYSGWVEPMPALVLPVGDLIKISI